MLVTRFTEIRYGRILLLPRLGYNLLLRVRYGFGSFRIVNTRTTITGQLQQLRVLRVIFIYVYIHVKQQSKTDSPENRYPPSPRDKSSQYAFFDDTSSRPYIPCSGGCLTSFYDGTSAKYIHLCYSMWNLCCHVLVLNVQNTTATVVYSSRIRAQIRSLT